MVLIVYSANAMPLQKKSEQANSRIFSFKINFIQFLRAISSKKNALFYKLICCKICKKQSVFNFVKLAHLKKIRDYF